MGPTRATSTSGAHRRAGDLATVAPHPITVPSQTGMTDDTVTVEIELDRGTSIYYEELCEEFGEELIDGSVDEQVVEHLRNLYDNRDQLRQQVLQAQQAQQAQTN